MESGRWAYDLVLKRFESAGICMCRVLVVDDDLGTLEYFAAILRMAGHNVTTARNGREALTFSKSYRFDTILSDLKLPDMTGLDVMAGLGVTNAETPFVCVTGFSSVSSAVDALKRGACDYVEKPIDEEMLLRIVQTAVSGRPRAVRRTIVAIEGADDNHSPVPTPPQPTSDLVIVALESIQRRFGDRTLRVRIVAGEIGVSTEHLCRLLKRYTSHGFGYHLQQARTRQAARLLRESRLSVKEIAYETGYASATRLAHYFKRFVGMVPVEYRRTVVNGDGSGVVGQCRDSGLRELSEADAVVKKRSQKSKTRD